MLGTLVLQPPAALDAIAHSGGQVDVQWDASISAALRPLEYVVLRRASGGDFAPIARTAALRLTDSPGSGTFDYVVRAAISTFTSGDSPVARAPTLP